MQRLLEKVETASMCLVLWALFCVVGLQFFTRYVLNDSLGWTEEIARMLLIVLTYVGAVICARNDTHIRVDIFLELLSKQNQLRYQKLVDLISTVFFGFLCWTAAQFALTTRLEMSSIEIPKSIIFWICSVSLGLMAFHYLMHLIRQIQEQRSSLAAQGEH